MAIGLFALWCSGKMLPGWISVMASVWFLGGLAIFCIGVVGLYTSRIFVETKMRPYTIIRQVHHQE
jgi:putative glycosyltransferase